MYIICNLMLYSNSFYNSKSIHFLKTLHVCLLKIHNLIGPVWEYYPETVWSSYFLTNEERKIPENYKVSFSSDERMWRWDVCFCRKTKIYFLCALCLPPMIPWVLFPVTVFICGRQVFFLNQSKNVFRWTPILVG